MTTIKSYTDIEQSKMLAEILPLESADMNWHELPSIGFFARAFSYKRDNGATEGLYPCWSLSALIEVLPNKIVVNNENYFLNFTKNNVEYRGIVTWDGQKCISTKAENLLDACYNMIVKLKKDNIL